MTVCFFGMYASDYSRNKILIKGLRQNGIRIVECNVRAHFIYGLRYLRLLKKFLEAGRKSDIIFVGFPGQPGVPLAWLLAKIFRKKLYFDVFYSLYNAYVFDRAYYSKGSWRAKFWYFIDWLSCVLADKVILDTRAHVDYFLKTFPLSAKKFLVVYVGTDTDILKPMKVAHDGFVAGFHGYYIPVQGVSTIIKAASLLKNSSIRFKLLGHGIDLAKCQSLVEELRIKNVEFLEHVPYNQLPKFICGINVYLGGPFGSSNKADLVIPNKVYEALACGRATIVAGTAAMRELLTDKKDCLMIPRDNPKALAETILRLRDNRELREKIAKSGLELARKRFSPRTVVKGLVTDMKLNYV